MKKIIAVFITYLVAFTNLFFASLALSDNVNIAPISLLLLSKSVIMEKKIPSLVLMTATDTDRILMAWIPGSDGRTAENKIHYDIHLSTLEDFSPSSSTLVKTVTGISQVEIINLQRNTLYYGKIVAHYLSGNSSPSNTLQSRTYENDIQLDSSTTVEIAEELGLGTHSTLDGTTYTYTTGNGTPPQVGSKLFSEDESGATTLRTVDSISSDVSTITVQTSDASLTEIIDTGSVSSSFLLFDMEETAASITPQSAIFKQAQSSMLADGSRYSSIEWKDKLLSAQQIVYAHHEEGLEVVPMASTSNVKMYPQDIGISIGEPFFSAEIGLEFTPNVITETQWGGSIIKHLDYAKFGATGTLDLFANASFDFSQAGTVNKTFPIWEKKWKSKYPIDATGLFVYQEIILTLEAKLSASAGAAINAKANAEYVKTLEVGVEYKDGQWKPYVENPDAEKNASVDFVIANEVGAEGKIQLIPKLEIRFYKVVGGSVSVEPYIRQSLTVEKTTDNPDFLNAHPDRRFQLKSFDVNLGMECNMAITLSIFNLSWDAFSQCVLGTTPSCWMHFNELELLSFPELNLYAPVANYYTTASLNLMATNGTLNSFNEASLEWEVFPSGNVTSDTSSCTVNGSTANCPATFNFSAQAQYHIFASGSGYGILAELTRQYEEFIFDSSYPGDTCSSGTQTVMWQGRQWQRCDDGIMYLSPSAGEDYCNNLILDGWTDWRVPTKDELRNLVVCTNGTTTPLQDPPIHPNTCEDGNLAPYDSPTIDASFECKPTSYLTSTYENTIGEGPWLISFFNGMAYDYYTSSHYVRCVR
ncbi:MAG: DUF1566 domain-containing protein [Desulfobulbaceae bacterium]|nr:DUF1566 domain-containing protein [Desulfobulbaceae bacterium]